MIDAKDIYYVAALLEGEGSFTVGAGTPKISFGMSDEDVVVRVCGLIGNPSTYTYQRPRRKRMWYLHMYGEHAAAWMMTVYFIMGIRRRGQIRRALDVFRRSALPPGKRSRCPHGHLLSKRRNSHKPWRYCPTCQQERDRRRQLNRTRDTRTLDLLAHKTVVERLDA